MVSSASFSKCRKYRYSLTREWDSDGEMVMFIALNPSTADDRIDDPTIRRCIGFAKQWGFGRLVVTNLFGFRSSDPESLRLVADPVGPENDDAIVRFGEAASRVVLAWGIHGGLLERDREVLRLIDRPYCLGLTKDGAPRHPLYLPGETALIRFKKPKIVRPLTLA